MRLSPHSVSGEDSVYLVDWQSSRRQDLAEALGRAGVSITSVENIQQVLEPPGRYHYARHLAL